MLSLSEDALTSLIVSAASFLYLGREFTHLVQHAVEQL